MGSASVFATAGGTHLYRAPLPCLGSSAKTHVPSPGDTRVPTQHGPGHSRTPVPVPLGPVSCSTGSLIVPVSSVRPSHGAQRHHTRARARSPACDPLGATGSEHGSGGDTHVCTDPHPCAHTRWLLHAHCTCMKLTHSPVHVQHPSGSRATLTSQPPSHTLKHHTHSLSSGSPSNTHAHLCMHNWHRFPHSDPRACGHTHTPPMS